MMDPIAQYIQILLRRRNRPPLPRRYKRQGGAVMRVSDEVIY